MPKKLTIDEYKVEWAKDREARRTHQAMMNYHYLLFKGIQLLNYNYSKETLEQMGLHINIPRTFTTIETICAQANRKIDINAQWSQMKDKVKAEGVGHLLSGEWTRSKSDNAKNEAEFDAFLFGSGYLLSKFYEKKSLVPVFNFNKKGEKTAKTEEKTTYQGMKAFRLDPFFVIPDRRAKTWNKDEPNSPKRVWYYSIWEIEDWKDYAEDMGYSIEGLEVGGYLDEMDYVKRLIDAIYLQNNFLNLRTRDQGTLVSGSAYEIPKMDTSNCVMVLQCFEKDSYKIFTGAGWNLAHDGDNPDPAQEIPIFTIKDHHIPGELEGIGEAEVLRWQQYEENKIHNLAYLQVLMNTVNRYAVVEELLKDPVEAKMSNPLKNIRLKFMPNVKLSDAIQPLQGQKTDYPQQFLTEVKNIGQSATGISDFNSGASQVQQSQTLGQSELMATAGNQRVLQKIEEMENRCIIPLLEHWLISVPYYYTDELEYRLNQDKGSVKFLPIDRKMAEDPHLISKYAVQEGVYGAQVKTVEDIFLAKGYVAVVFIDDLMEGYNLSIKTSLTGLLQQDLINKYTQAINFARADNADNLKMSQPPEWDTTKLTGDLLRQFSDIISDPDEYKLSNSQPMPTATAVPGEQMPGQPPAGQPPAGPAQNPTSPAPQPQAPVGEPVPAPTPGQPVTPVNT